MENLNEGKKKKGGMAYEAALREIDAQSAIVAMEAKIEKLKEMATKKKEKMKMVQEDENLSELIDKRAMNEMMKEIKQIEKMQEKLEKLYEKKNGKKMPEMVDEDEEMNEYGSSTQMIPDKKEDGTYDSRAAYAMEELVAEMGSAIQSCLLGLTSKPKKESAQYLNIWISRLENNSKLFWNMCSHASKAVSYIEKLQKNKYKKVA